MLEKEVIQRVKRLDRGGCHNGTPRDDDGVLGVPRLQEPKGREGGWPCRRQSRSTCESRTGDRPEGSLMAGGGATTEEAVMKNRVVRDVMTTTVVLVDESTGFKDII